MVCGFVDCNKSPLWCWMLIIVKSACVGAGTTRKISIPSFQCCYESSTVLKKVVFFFFLKVIPCIIAGRV